MLVNSDGNFMKEIMLPWSLSIIEKKKIRIFHSRLPYPLWERNTNTNLPFP